MADQRAKITWQGDVPVSADFDDPYYSLENGQAEADHVFLAGNDLPARFCDGFHIAELGFGTGLNLLVALSAFRAAAVPGVLYFTSFEAFPMTLEQVRAAQAAFPELAGIAAELAPCWAQDSEVVALDDLRFTLIRGDARETLPNWTDKADAWFLDGFSPAKNPALWEPSLLEEVGRKTRPGGSCATYTAAGHVRRALDTAGFDMRRRQGYGRKRHMSVGILRA